MASPRSYKNVYTILEKVKKGENTLSSIVKAVRSRDAENYLSDDYEVDFEESGSGGFGWSDIEVAPNDLVKMDSKSGSYIFERDGVTVILNRIKPKTFSFDAF